MGEPCKREPRSRRWLRLALFCALLSCASLWWQTRQVAAHFSERALSLGRQLDRMSEVARDATTLELNGARLTLSTSVRAEPIEALLGRFAALCARDSGGVSEELDQLASQGAQLPAAIRKGSFGVFRTEREGREGSAACFARRDGGGLLETVRRLGVVLESGDFGALGQLRYVFARRIDEQQVHVITVSSHGALPLAQMFPEAGDAPGSDIVEGVRPPDARRVLSARVAGSKLQAAMYESSARPKAALHAYDQALQARGFAIGELGKMADALVADTRVYLRSDETLLVLAEPRQGKTAVSVFRLPSGGYVAVP